MSTNANDDSDESTTPNSLLPDSLYALLSYRGELGAWEWSFFVPNSSVTPVGKEGTLFYVKIHTPNPLANPNNSNTNSNNNNSTGSPSNPSPYWKFEIDNGRDIVSSPEAVALVRLASVADLGQYEEIVGLGDGHSGTGLSQMFSVVAIPDPAKENRIPIDFSSRSWFLDAVGMLHDCGVIQCDDVFLLEREIRRYAFSAMDKYLQNRGA